MIQDIFAAIRVRDVLGEDLEMGSVIARESGGNHDLEGELSPPAAGIVVKAQPPDWPLRLGSYRLPACRDGDPSGDLFDIRLRAQRSMEARRGRRGTGACRIVLARASGVVS